MFILKQLKKLYIYLKNEWRIEKYIPTYKIAEILQNEENDYIIVVQVVNKSCYFHSKPEELLADDTVVDQFSPRDIRTLTYLGYLGIHSPKYTILAKKLAAGTDKFVFALKKRGQNTIITKTADEISKEHTIIKNMLPQDLIAIGYTVAMEGFQSDKKEILNLTESE